MENTAYKSNEKPDFSIGRGKKPLYVFYFALLLSSIMIIAFAIKRGFFVPYTATSDCDFVYISQVLLWYSDFKMTYLGHNGYFFILLLSLWIKIGALLGSLKEISIYGFEQSSNVADFYSPLVFAGRFFVLFLSVAFIVIYGLIVKSITRSFILGAAAVLLLSVERGLLLHSVIIRPELVSSLCFLIAVYCLFQSQKESNQFWIYPWACGFFSYLAVLTKIQIIIGLFALPFLAILWGRKWDNNTLKTRILPKFFIGMTQKWHGRLVAVTLASFAFVFPFSHIRYFIIDYQRKLFLLPFFLFIIGAIILYHYLYVRNWKTTGTWLILILMGASSSFLFYFAKENDDNIRVVVNFIGVLISHSHTYSQKQGLNEILQKLFFGFIKGLQLALQRNFNILEFQNEPLCLANTVILMLSIYLWKIKKYKKVMTAAGFWGLGIGLEVFFYFRYFADFYRIYVECFKLIGLFILVSSLFQISSEKTKFKVRFFFGLMICLLTGLQVNSNFDIKNKILHQTPEAICKTLAYTPRFAKYLEQREVKNCSRFVLSDYKQSKYYADYEK
jgi:hypothetical protein